MGQAVERTRPRTSLADLRFDGLLRSPLLPALALTALAGSLRLGGLELTPPNPFYDAAVRSMSESWHNFFFAAYDPSAQLAVDKTPVDMWFQVLSIKLFGFNQRALVLPAAVSGTLAVPLLFDLVRRSLGLLAGICAGIALAVLPVSVVAARSDAVDAMAMAFAVLAAWLCVLSVRRGRARWLYLGAVAMGIAFNTKLFQALLPVPALALLYVAGARFPLRRRLAHLAIAGLILAATSVCWIVAVSLAPGHHPYVIESAHGGVWNAVFVADGLHRLLPHRHLSTPGLFAPIFAARLGPELVAAWLFGGLAVLVVGRRAWARRGSAVSVGAAVGLAAWLVIGTVLYQRMPGLRLRYLEGFTPAVAAVLGIGVAALAALSARGRGGAVAALAGGLLFTPLILGGLSSTDAVNPTNRAVAAGAAAVIVALAAVAAAERIAKRPGLVPVITVAVAGLALVSLLSGPFRISRELVRTHASDSGPSGQLSDRTLGALDRFLKAHRDGTEYEYAASDPSRAGGLIIRDGQPTVLLLAFNRHPVLGPRRVRHLVMKREVRWFVMGPPCSRATPWSCIPVLRWVESHGTYVTRRYRLPAEARVFELTPASVSR